MVNATDNIAKGDLETLIEIKSNDEIGKLAEATQRMQISLQAASKQASSQDWIKTGLMKLNEVIQGELELTEISNKIITEIANYLEAKNRGYLSNGYAGKQSYFEAYRQLCLSAAEKSFQQV